MRRARPFWFVVALLLPGVSMAPALAVSPSAVIVYGGTLEQPVLLRPATNAEADSINLLSWQAGPYFRPTRTVLGEPELVSRLRNRPYVNLSIFWGQYERSELKPGTSSQHGRFYPPTGTDPAVVVATVPDMQKKTNPVPEGLDGFAALWTLSPQELNTLRKLGFPGL
jgi:hypothetical protein